MLAMITQQFLSRLQQQKIRCKLALFPLRMWPLAKSIAGIIGTPSTFIPRIYAQLSACAIWQLAFCSFYCPQLRVIGGPEKSAAVQSDGL